MNKLTNKYLVDLNWWSSLFSTKKNCNFPCLMPFLKVFDQKNVFFVRSVVLNSILLYHLTANIQPFRANSTNFDSFESIPIWTGTLFSLCYINGKVLQNQFQFYRNFECKVRRMYVCTRLFNYCSAPPFIHGHSYYYCNLFR